MEMMRSVTGPAAEDAESIRQLTIDLEDEFGVTAVLDRKVKTEGGMVTLIWRVSPK